MDKSNIYFSNGKKKLQENTRWNVNKTIRCLVRNKIKHQKKYKQGNLRHPWERFQSFSNSASLIKRTIEILPSGVGYFPILYSPCVRYYISPHRGWSLTISLIINEAIEDGTIPNEVTHMAVSPKFVVAAYRQCMKLFLTISHTYMFP